MNKIHRQVESRLAEETIRYTSGRRSVVDVMASSAGPLSAAEIEDGIGGDVPLSSIYRTLAILEESGVVTPHLGTKGMARYELAEWLTGHHHHLVCTECGIVSDVTMPDDIEGEVERLVSRVSALASFRPADHAIEIEGLCAACA